MSALQVVADRMAAAGSVADVRTAFLQHAGAALGSDVRAIYLHGPDDRPVSADAVGLSDSVLRRYEELGRDCDPVLDLIVAEHVAVSALDLLGSDRWHATDLYDHVMAPADLEHYIAAPLLGQGRIVGTLGFTRRRGAAPFSTAEIGRAAALAHHVSALVARFPAEPVEPGAALPLTARDREIVALVVRGRTNAEIGAALHISANTVKQTLKRIFARTGVQNRTELAARAARG
ncbi:LuxR C-terminal-related transcriptional regulator [Pseudonocardia sp. WMMC193]|uniref:helix-turn-helix transcriptional regulator n=1 Tax=Pseudonocardia sp. WMMC193 TaxID=2911965 RepID=UPI001F03152C|nr:LuxR C-terminal-related transcriptional regulator [Pseudonocardia sp. WMMC193]MCF7553105.1 LuxR C-terminal-related transcriptional regulator [Pseudonocardia sp. WMMC193]